MKTSGYKFQFEKLLALLLISVLISLQANGQGGSSETSKVVKAFDIDPGATIMIENKNGDIIKPGIIWEEL